MKASFVLLGLALGALALACGKQAATDPTEPGPPLESSVPLRLVSGLGPTTCADALQDRAAAGTALATRGCNGGTTQSFAVQSTGAIAALGAANLCVEVSDPANDGAPVVLATCTGGLNQKWTSTAINELRTAANDKCLEVAGGQPGGRLVIRTCGGSASQKWVMRDVPEAASTVKWTPCARGGENCFGLIALRDVRIVAPNGATVQGTFYGDMLCDPQSFGGRTPDSTATLAQLRCEYGPLQTQALINPTPRMGGLRGQVMVAMGDTGVSGPVRRGTTVPPQQNPDDGAFRIRCRVTKFAFDDPIVYPGQPGASHLHVFFGNTEVSATSTSQSLANGGNSTCLGGTLNRTAYWAPALIDQRSGVVQTPVVGTFYYKTGYNMDPRSIRALPAGLRMIAGDKNNTGYQENAIWTCAAGTDKSSIPPNCPVGDTLRLTISFPQCWDGVNLDSPNHKSHMAYPNYRNPPERSSCPSTHPVAVPVITEFFDYPVPATGATAYWRLSSDMYSSTLPGGLSAHADWMMAWDAPTMEAMVRQCLNAARDCGVGLMADGTVLEYP